MKFSDMMIKNLKPTNVKFYKREANGFTIRVSPTGGKTWLFVYTFKGVRKELRLGKYPAMKLATARTAFENASQLLREGEDPKEVKRAKEEIQQREEAAIRQAPTVQHLVDEFLDKWVRKIKKPRSAYNDERSLKKDIIPCWKDRKAKSIRRRDAILLLEEVAKRAPGQAQYLAKVCRKMFSFGMQREIVEVNPFAEITATIPELSAKSRDRILSSDDVRAVWHRIENGPGSGEVKRILKLILVTAQRPSEVCGIRKSELDGRWWTIPAKRAKNGRTHRVFLTDLALSLLPESDVDEYFPSPRIAPTPDGPKAPIRVGTVSYVVRRASYYGLDHWTPHDLRRTARTFFAEIGIPREHAEAVINHTLPGVEGTYNRYRYDREKQLSLEAWESKLTTML